MQNAEAQLIQIVQISWLIKLNSMAKHDVMGLIATTDLEMQINPKVKGNSANS